MDAPDVQPQAPAAQYTDSVTKYLVIYGCIVVLAALQFVVAHTHLDTSAMFARMLLIAIAEAGLALMFFMHLWAEKRGFLLFVLVFTVFVLLAMQYGWTDSNRMQTGAPFTQPKSGVIAQ
jgi:caa(3)-type oxidase subunit IV